MQAQTGDSCSSGGTDGLRERNGKRRSEMWGKKEVKKWNMNHVWVHRSIRSIKRIKIANASFICKHRQIEQTTKSVSPSLCVCVRLSIILLSFALIGLPIKRPSKDSKVHVSGGREDTWPDATQQNNLGFNPQTDRSGSIVRLWCPTTVWRRETKIHEQGHSLPLWSTD